MKNPLFVSNITNGVLLNSGSYKIYKFTSNGSITINGNKPIYYVVIGGGAGGGAGKTNSGYGGYGGGGVMTGIIYNNNTTTYTITVGSSTPGLYSSASLFGSNGAPSSINYNSTVITANGGWNCSLIYY